MIRVSKEGRITRGKYSGWSVVVEDDERGGYSIVISADSDSRPSEGYDYWVEKQGLEQFFTESGWDVVWAE